jgi:hypothetical protein
MKLFPHLKRRVNDTVEILKESYSIISWGNLIWSIPLVIFVTFFVPFLMLFEDYDEIDELTDRIRGKFDELNK